jgi:membrane protein implicated in regulation of membrane protease activity
MNRLSINPLVPRHKQIFSPQGEVIKVIRQEKEWRVRFRATDWTARSTRALVLRPGDLIRITDIENITLWIEPI